MPNIQCDILIKNIKGLVQVRPGSLQVLRGAAMADLPVLADAYLAIGEGIVIDYGKMETMPSLVARHEIDARDRFVFPSFVDSHTHVVFPASREEEFLMRIKGFSYAAIAAAGGGILNSARKLQGLSEEDLFQSALPRVKEMARTGTGALEIKSGYGLTLDDELKMLRVARRIGKESDLTVKTTFLGAHAVPAGWKKDDYVQEVIEEMIPAVAEAALADYIDVFCEEGFFSAGETERILEAGLAYGMKGRVHANQLSRSGGVQAAVRKGAVSVDHLEHIDDEEIGLLLKGNTMPTLLPGAAFFLGSAFPPARRMLEAGLPLTLASDYNPGSAPSGNMLLILSLACIGMKLTPAEAINAVSVNAALALGIGETHGSIGKGKTASVFVTRPIPSIDYMPYAFGGNHIETVILRGVFQ